MSEGRALVHPMAIAFAARAVDVPKMGHQLVCSAIYPFSLDDGSPVKPADWYATVATMAGPDMIPDSLNPLVNAEVTVLGTVPPVEEEKREARLRCGQVDVEFLFAPDAENPEAPIPLGPESANWHAQENPMGRGGPEDERRPLILNKERMDSPLWFGPTPFEHPMRQNLVGTPSDPPKQGWPPDANQKVFNDAHPRLQAESMHPGDPIIYDGFADRPFDGNIPLYQIEMAYTDDKGEWDLVTSRINSVVLIPSASMAAMIWRGVIPLGRDQFGEKITAAVAALQDANEPRKEADHWAMIAAERWSDPMLAADDRPLLPPAIAAAMPSPFAVPEELDTIEDRRKAAEEWMRGEAGLPEENPFADQIPPEAAAAASLSDMTDDDEEPPDLGRMEDLAVGALSASRRRHEEAGFETPEPEEVRTPEWRGDSLDAEINTRLSGPYQSKLEVEMAKFLRTTEGAPQQPEEVLDSLTGARMLNPHPALSWPAMTDEEGTRFGEAVKGKLDEGALERHLDVSGAIFAEGTIVAEREFGEVLLEETVWRGAHFVKCNFNGTTFAGTRFENCQFVDCVFHKVNIARVTLQDCKFMRCEFRDTEPRDMVWMGTSFESCVIEKVTFVNLIMRDTEFASCEWREVTLSDGLSINLTFRETLLDQVTFTAYHAPHTTFQRVRMYKVFTMARGFPGSLFEEVDAETCGFLGVFHFNESTFIKSGFRETGFTNAIFKDGQIAGGCKFEMCDFTGAIFDNFNISGVRFPECGFITSIWMNKCQAVQTSFFACLLRAVDFGDTVLTGAVFVDADIEDMEALPDNTIGADFTGTVRVL